MTNPSIAGTTGTFAISVFQKGTNIIYDRRTDIPGVSITSSQMAGVTLVPSNSAIIQGKNKLMNYILAFQIRNALAQGAVITVQFPSTLQLDTSDQSLNYIKYGLEDISEASPVSMDIDTTNDIVTLSNFKAVNAHTTISIQVRLQNPPLQGNTGPAVITTYADSTLESPIDQNSVDASTNIVAIGKPPLTTHIY